MTDTREAIAACAANPEQFRELDPILFEAVVAELLAGFGWRVNVTPPSRDGGYDILGVTTDLSGLETSWLVECKRYHREHKVGVEIARQIVGVKSHLGVPNAVLVTSASFTNGAQELSRARRDLSLVDSGILGTWATAYMPRAGKTYTAERSFASCFISHSSKDSAFAEKLAARLRSSGVPVWYAPEDIEPGEKIYEQVKQAIGSFDRLVVILSPHSMASQWVQTELALALQRERMEKRRVLFPVAMASIDEIRRWECVDPDSGMDIARELRAYFIPNFANWKDPANFESAAAKVVAALQIDSQDPSPSERVASISNLDPAVTALREGVHRGVSEQRIMAAVQLGLLKAAAAAAVPDLRKALSDPGPGVSEIAAWALAEIGTPEARSALLDFEPR